MSCDLVNVAAPLFGPERHEMNGFTTAGVRDTCKNLEDKTHYSIIVHCGIIVDFSI